LFQRLPLRRLERHQLLEQIQFVDEAAAADAAAAYGQGGASLFLVLVVALFRLVQVGPEDVVAQTLPLAQADRPDPVGGGVHPRRRGGQGLLDDRDPLRLGQQRRGRRRSDRRRPHVADATAYAVLVAALVGRRRRGARRLTRGGRRRPQFARLDA